MKGVSTVKVTLKVSKERPGENVAEKLAVLTKEDKRRMAARMAYRFYVLLRRDLKHDTFNL